MKKVPDANYASARRVEKLEQTVTNMQSAIESQTEVIADLRASLMPVISTGRPASSPAVRSMRSGVSRE